MARIDAFFRLMHAQNASDLHLSAGCVPCLRIQGDLEPVKFKELGIDELMTILAEVAPANKIQQFEETGDVGFAYELDGVGRFRANYFRQAHGVSAVFRQIPTRIMTIEQLGLPAVTRRFAMLEKGLVLMTGPTGSGKSTTLAAVIGMINATRPVHIVTLEDPVEFAHPQQRATVNQRELGSDFSTFAAGLRSALRQAPKVIMVGELRDAETVEIGLKASETGHLVLATLHTIDAGQAIGRLAAIEIMGQSLRVRDLIREGEGGDATSVLGELEMERGSGPQR